MVFIQTNPWLILYYAVLLGVYLLYGLIHSVHKTLPDFFAKQKFKIIDATIILLISGILLHSSRIFVLTFKQNYVIGSFVAVLFETLYPPIVLMAVWLFFRFRLRESLAVIGFRKREWLDDVFVGLKWVLAIHAILSLLIFLIYSMSGYEIHAKISGHIVERSNGLFGKLIKGRVNLLGLPVAFLELSSLLVLGSITEEILFRGIYYSALRKKINALPAIFISSILFTFSHALFFVDGSTFVSGCLFAYLYERTKSITTAISAHIAENILVFIYTIYSSDVLRRFDVEGFLAFDAAILSGFFIITWMVSFYLKGKGAYKESGANQ